MKDENEGPLLGYYVHEWNKKIYRNEDDSFYREGELNAEEFWNEFQIKSGPKFREACWSHIPARWADDVRTLLKKVQDELGDKVSFTQIKEKFCQLTIYYSCEDDHAKQRMSELISECVDQHTHLLIQTYAV